MKTKSGVNQFWISIPLGVLAVAAFLMATLGPRFSEANAAAKDTPAPDWVLPGVDGKEVRSSDFKGKVVVIDFWATWCPPCRAEIPSFVDLYRRYAKDGLAIVGMSLDENGAAVVKPFMKRYQINYPVVLANAKAANAFGGVDAIPATFLINRKGQIVQKHVGLTKKADFEKELEPLLKEKE